MSDLPDTPGKKSEVSESARNTERNDTKAGLEDQVRSNEPVERPLVKDSGQVEKRDPSMLEKIGKSADFVLDSAGKLAHFASAETLEKASRIAGSAEKLVTNAHVPDALARGGTKAIDFLQANALKLEKSEFLKKVSGTVEKIEKVTAVSEGIKRYREDREAGMDRKGAIADAGFKTAGTFVSKQVEADFGKKAAKVFETVTDEGARGVGLTVDAVGALARGDQTHLAKLSDAAAKGDLGGFALVGDITGDALATGRFDRASARITDAAKSGQLGTAARLGDWIGDHVWTLTHRSR